MTSRASGAPRNYNGGTTDMAVALGMGIIVIFLLIVAS